MSSLVFLQYLTTVFDNIEDAIMLVGVEPKGAYRLLMANEGFFRGTGYLRSSIGALIKDVVVEEASYEHLARQYRKAITDKQTIDYTHWYQVPMGRQAYAVKLIPLLNAVGEVVQVASVSRNITEIQDLRDKLEETTKTLDALTDHLHTSV